MAKKIIFDSNNRIEPYSIILSSRTKELQGQLSCVDPKSIVYKTNLNGADELTFTLYRYFNDREDPLWDEIKNLKLVYVKELNEYFEIRFDINESNSTVKNVTAVSLCEAELSQTMLYNIEINTELDIDREDYVVTRFWNAEKPEGSLLHRILEKVPHYKVVHVDESLASLQRTFSIDNVSVYDFLTGDCAKEFNCLFQFDSTNRTISVYDLYTVCMDDNCSYYTTNKRRYRGAFHDKCPICGGNNLYYYGNDTTVFVDKDNLTKEIQFKTDVDNIKNTFKLEAGDDDMTAAIINNNPNGSAYIYYFSDEAKEDMPPELVEKMETYDELYDSYQEEYTTLSRNIYNSLDQLLYLNSTMMPTVEHESTTAAKEAAKLTAANLSPVALQSVNERTTVATVNSAVKNYAKVFVNTGKYKVEISTGYFVYQGSYSGTWTGNFTITNYADKEDTAISNVISIQVNQNYETYIQQRINKQIAKDNAKLDDDSIFDVLGIKNLTNFTNALKLYCLNRLTSFYDAIQSCMDVLVQVDQARAGSEYYTLYFDYYQKLQACQSEIDKRQASIDAEYNTYEGYINRRDEIQKALDFRAYIGEDLYKDFCMYRRETTFKNENYISDSLDNTTIFDNANEFIETAKKEAVISGTAQHSIDTNLYNLLVMKEFQPIVDNFELGNFIRVKINDDIYRLRLVEYTINFGSIETLTTRFSDMTKTADGVNDIRSILDSAKSMATSYSTTMRQADSGKNANTILTNMREKCLEAALYTIQNNDTEEITLDNHGLSGRSYDDVSNSYSDEQIRLTHNMLAFTSDNWQHARLALGKIRYTLDGVLHDNDYGLCADAVLSGIIIGGQIYSDNYSSQEGSKAGTYINLRTGDFSIGGGQLEYNAAQDKLVMANTSLNAAVVTSSEIIGSSISSTYTYSNGISTISIDKGQLVNTQIMQTSNGNATSKLIINSGSLFGYVEDQIKTHIDLQNWNAYDWGLKLDTTYLHITCDNIHISKPNGDVFYKGYTGYLQDENGNPVHVVNGIVVSG